MFKRLVIIVIVLGGLFGGVFWYRHTLEQKTAAAMASYTPPPTVVPASPATKQHWIRHIHAIGEVTSLNNVELKPQVSGNVIAIHVDSGDKVKAGDPLLDISHQVESASLMALNADVHKAQQDLNRYKTLYNKGVVSKETLNKYSTAFNDAKSRRHAELARIQRNTLSAPFSGTIGISNVDLGEYVRVDQPLLRLTKLAPIYIDFYVRQQDLSKITKDLTVNATVDAWPGETFSGQISSINPYLTKKTRRILVRATFDNKEHKLRPGMFCNLAVVLPHKENVITAPATAVTYRMAGDTVYVLEPRKSPKGSADKDAKGKKQRYTAKEVRVQAGKTRGNRTVLHTGVKAGDLLAVAGQNKLYNGAEVVVDNSITPAKAGN